MVNRLVDSPSLYLRKHGENPIDWWPWCDEALQQGQRDDKPIFLSIGYPSCHWCTVMEGEACSNPTIADYSNPNFLPIKVDREECSDLDSIYMQVLQMLTGSGGWPLNVVLTPDTLVPFYGGTYFPVEPKYGRPRLLRIFKALRQFYNSDKGKLGAMTQEVMANLHKALLDLHQASLGSAQPGSANAWLQLAITTQQEFDQWLWSPDQGGYFNIAMGWWLRGTGVKAGAGVLATLAFTY
ncbi:MAG: thioredoxin domain-containing protein [Leptolyngbyaceae cyanobacterium SM2_3_12]|nr:thioredoxin domain-containing protein [Leptolyngbyaceae cyanobacterium SM2_3_12]